ncbi:Vacuolar protein sorting-associated protein 72, partial [Halocaridina rubra]
SEVEVDDEVDSDFSIDENDEPVSDQDEESKGEKRKRGRLVTKAYKEPKPVSKDATTPKIKEKKSPKKHMPFDLATLEKKGIRKSTQLKSAETVKRQRERADLERRRAMKKQDRVPSYPKLTQEELLEEAKLTEEINLKSLEKYELAELDRKKPKVVRRGFTTPYIRYQSTAMPLIQELKSSEEMEVQDSNVNVDTQEYQVGVTGDVLQTRSDNVPRKTLSKDAEYCERTFITFSNEGTFKRTFRRAKPKAVQKNICPITRLSARYFDPVTQLPYATLQAFRVLREAYYQQLEDKGDRNNKQVAKWLVWRREYKKARASAQSLKPTVTPLQASKKPSVPLPSVARPVTQAALAPTSSPVSQNAVYTSSVTLTSSPASTVTSVAAVAQILRSAVSASTAIPSSIPTSSIATVAASSLHLTRPSVTAVTNAQAGGSFTNLQGQTVQLVQTVGRSIGSQVRPSHQMVVVTSAGPTGSLQLGGANLLVQGGTGGTTNLLVQGGASGTVGNLQIVQAGGGSGVQVVQASQVVQGGRFTIRPVANQTFTNLQSLLK